MTPSRWAIDSVCEPIESMDDVVSRAIGNASTSGNRDAPWATGSHHSYNERITVTRCEWHPAVGQLLMAIKVESSAQSVKRQEKFSVKLAKFVGKLFGGLAVG